MVYFVSISWIIYLFHDIRSYNYKLNKFLDEQNDLNSEEENEIIRSQDNKSFYSVINRKTGEHVNLYETKDAILNNIKNKEVIYLNRINQKSKIKKILLKRTRLNRKILRS